ncbi:MAG: ATP-grasp domain-containing protein, partial [Dehalococcoidia bacterium]|nr:ATP-grasp domain-containing protein [Dehalococcoidia bacterium]
LALADYKIIASTRNAEETVKAAGEFNKKLRINGVMTLANDVPLTVARVAEELGLPGITVASARLASDKLAMKEKFSSDGVPVPEFREVFSSKDVAGAANDWGFPVVIKPVDGRGARGVLRLIPSTDLDWAFTRARDISEQKRVMVERFIEGLQLSTESMVYQGQCYTASWSQRNYEFLDRFAPYIIENGGVLPADLSNEDIDSVEKIVAQAATSLGIENGSVKGDIVMDKDGPKVIELAARLSGGYLATDQIPLARGVDLVKQTIKLALGESLDVAELIPRDLCKLGIRYFFPEPGRIAAIHGFDELDRFEWITKKMLSYRVGDVVEPVTDHTKRSGFVHTRGETFKEAEERAIYAASTVKIETVPVSVGV